MIPMHPEAVADDPRSVRWVLAPEAVPVQGEVGVVPGGLGALLASGVVCRIAGLPGAVVVTLGPMQQFKGLHPVLVDDIISSGRTMEVTIRQLLQQGFAAPIVVGVHGLFSEDAFARLQGAGAGRIVSCNSVPHASNAIDLTELIAHELTQLLARHFSIAS